jgi:hypothetical protein
MSSPTDNIASALHATNIAASQNQSSSSAHSDITIPPGGGPVGAHPQTTGANPSYAGVGTSQAQLKRTALLEHIAAHLWNDVRREIKQLVSDQNDLAAKVCVLDSRVTDISRRKNTLTFTLDSGKTFDVAKNTDALSLYDAYASVAEGAAPAGNTSASTLVVLQAAASGKSLQPKTNKPFKQVKDAIPDLLTVKKLYDDLVGPGSMYLKVLDREQVSQQEVNAGLDLKKAAETLGKASQLVDRMKDIRSGLTKIYDLPFQVPGRTTTLDGGQGASRKWSGAYIRQYATDIRDVSAAWTGIRAQVLEYRNVVPRLNRLTDTLSELTGKFQAHEYAGADSGVEKLTKECKDIEQICARSLREIEQWEPSVQSTVGSLKRKVLEARKSCYSAMVDLLRMRDTQYNEWKVAQAGASVNMLTLMMNKLDCHKQAAGYALRRVDITRKIIEGESNPAAKRTLENTIAKDQGISSNCCAGVFNAAGEVLGWLEKHDADNLELKVRVSVDMAEYGEHMVQRRNEPKTNEGRQLLLQSKINTKDGHLTAFNDLVDLHNKLVTDANKANVGHSENRKLIARRIEVVKTALVHVNKAVEYLTSLPKMDRNQLVATLGNRLFTQFQLYSAYVEVANTWSAQWYEGVSNKMAPDDLDAFMDEFLQALESAEPNLSLVEGMRSDIQEKFMTFPSDSESLQKKGPEIDNARAEIHNNFALYHVFRQHTMRIRSVLTSDVHKKLEYLEQSDTVGIQTVKEAEKAAVVAKSLFARRPDAKSMERYATVMGMETMSVTTSALAFVDRVEIILSSEAVFSSDHRVAVHEILQRVGNTASNYVAYFAREKEWHARGMETRRAMSDFASRLVELVEDLAWLQQACQANESIDRQTRHLLDRLFADMQRNFSRTVENVDGYVDAMQDFQGRRGLKTAVTRSPSSSRTIGTLDVIRTRYGEHIAGRMLKENRFEALDVYGNAMGHYVRDGAVWHKSIDSADQPEQEIEQVDKQHSLQGAQNKQIDKKIARGERLGKEADRFVEEARSLANLTRSPEAMRRKYDEADTRYAAAIKDYRWVAERSSSPQKETATAQANRLTTRREQMRSEALRSLTETIKVRTSGTRDDGEAPVLKCFDLRHLIEQGEIENVTWWTEEGVRRNRYSPTAALITDPQTKQPIKTWIRKYSFDIKPGASGECGKFEAHFHYDTEQDAASRPDSFRSGHVKRDEQRNFGVLARREGIKIFRAELSEGTRQALNGIAVSRN